jgi:hypothetical protein
MPALDPPDVYGKEYSNAPADETADGTADPHQVIYWYDSVVVVDSVDYTPLLPGGLQEATQVDALAYIWDNPYEFWEDDAYDYKRTPQSLLVSFTGSPDIHYSAPAEYAPVHGTPPNVGVWAPAAAINPGSRPEDVDGLKIWGLTSSSPQEPIGAKANRFSLAGDPANPGTGQRVSVWNWWFNGDPASPFLYASDIAAAIGRRDLAGVIDVDAMMVFDGARGDLLDIGHFTFEGDASEGLAPDMILFSIAPVDVFDGGEIWLWVYAGPGSTATFLVHGGETWDTAHSVADHFGLSDDFENINALAAVRVPEPATLLLLAAGIAGIAARRRSIRRHRV